MVGNLFSRDNHSENIPRFYNVSVEESLALMRLISGYYHLGNNELFTAKAIGGSNLNSKNFIINNFYVKIIEVVNDIGDLANLPIIAEKLANCGFASAKFIENNNGEFLTHHVNDNGQKICFYIQEFVSGGFYAGVQSELSSCIDVIQRLPQAVEDIRPNLRQISYYQNWNPYDVAGMVEPLILAAQKNPGPFDNVANHYFGMARDITLENLVFGVANDKLNHVDLHPHNILMNNCKVACLLDLESFWAIPENISIGFGIFKLARKSIANGLMTIDQVRALLSRSIDTKKLMPFVQLEIARRFLTILKLHYIDRDYRWDTDINKHSMGFMELKQIF